MDNFFDKATSNIRDVVAYVLLILGIILLFFHHIYGGLLVGLVAGVYFFKEIIYLIKNYEHYVESKELGKTLIGAGLLLAFLISAPAVFLGIAIAIGLTILITNTDTAKRE